MIHQHKHIIIQKAQVKQFFAKRWCDYSTAVKFTVTLHAQPNASNSIEEAHTLKE